MSRIRLGTLLVPLFSTVAACGGGGGSSTPIAPSPATTTLTISGTVTNIITDAKVSSAQIQVGSTSTSTGADGTYTLTVPRTGQQSFMASAAGYHTRESSLSLTGSATVNLQLIPQGDGFNLTLFDHLFRNKGTTGTERWTTQPTFEIWTQEFSCLELDTDYGDSACARYQAKGPAPAIFETKVRDSIAKMGQLTGNVLSGAPITMKTHPVGTSFPSSDWGTTAGTISFSYTTGLYGRNAASASGFVNNKLHIDYGANVYTDATIHLHELAHAVGFHHPDGPNNMPQPGIMGPWPYQWTSADELLVRILYLRPFGSLTPDKDPANTVINCQAC